VRSPRALSDARARPPLCSKLPIYAFAEREGPAAAGEPAYQACIAYELSDCGALCDFLDVSASMGSERPVAERERQLLHSVTTLLEVRRRSCLSSGRSP
jgi:hypothetical protein